MFNIIPLILIVVSLAVIIIIVVKKFSILANLDVESIPAEREAKFKEQIISNRLKRSFFKYYNRLARGLKPVGTGIGGIFIWFYEQLVEFKDNYNKENMTPSMGGQAIEKMFTDAEELINGDKTDEAEKKYIEIISLDSKNDKAFRALGELYYRRKDYNEAKQSYEHALKLLEQKHPPYNQTGTGGDNTAESVLNALTAGIYFELALVSRAIEKFEEAIADINKALRLEPNNPRYLDIKLEISIINKDKISALDAFEKLQAVNPENQKLAEWEKQVGEI